MPRTLLIAVALLVATRTASAQYYPTDFTQQTFNAMNISTSFALSNAMLNATAGRVAPTSTVTSGKLDVATKLAATYPEEKRADARRLFGTLLDTYPKLEKQLGIPAGDLAGAITLFLVASYEAYTGHSVDPSRYPKLIEQVRSKLATSPALAEATPRARRELFEQMVILGMFVAALNGQLQQHADPQLAEVVRSAAKGYLAKLLGGDPDKLAITDAGLVMR